MKTLEKADGLDVIHELFCEGLNRRGIVAALLEDHSVPKTTSYKWLKSYFASDKHVKHIGDLRTNLGNSLLIMFERNFDQGNRAHDRVAMEAFDRILNLYPMLRQEEIKKVEPITVQLVGYGTDGQDTESQVK